MKHVGDPRVRYVAQQRDPLREAVRFRHLLQMRSHRSVPGDEKVNPGETFARQRNDAGEQVNPFPVRQPRGDGHGDSPRLSLTPVHAKTPLRRIRDEANGVHRVRYDGHPLRRHARPQHRVLLRRVTHANHVVTVGEGQHQQLVHVYVAGVREAEQGVVREHALVSHGSSVEARLVAHHRKRLMRVNDGDPLAEQDQPQ